MLTIDKIKKRSGDIVEFDIRKITAAIHKAFIAQQVPIEMNAISEISNHVLKHLQLSFDSEKIPSVEDVQDIVEKVLVEAGFYEVAKAYILYRYEHAKSREEKQKDILKKIETNNLYVLKANGQREKFSLTKIRKTLQEAAHGLESDLELEAIAEQCQLEVHENIKTTDIEIALIMATRSLIERDPAYSRLAARLLMRIIAKNVIGDHAFKGNYEANYRRAFINNIKEAVNINRLDAKLLEFDLESLSNELKPERDDLLLYMGLQTLFDRYFLRNPETKQILETPQMMWLRVAMGLGINEKAKEKYAARFYEVISTLRFVPSTPTLFHSGTTHPQLSSCYLTSIKDSLEHIFKCLGDNAQLSKWSGGLGNDWTNIRGTGSLIKGTGVESQGVIPFLKIANDTTVAINRSGRRRGATCAYLETWHYDIEDFLELRKNTGDERRRTHDMNTANWIPDLFMKRVRDYGQWTLFSPDEVPDLHHLYGKKFEERYIHYEKLADQGQIKTWKRLNAVGLWKKMITMLFETGHPWITFKDPCNIRSPQDHVGVVHSSNLCTEITLNTSAEETAVCNLGSLNLAKHIQDNKIAAELIADTVETAVRMLDNVIDINFYPTKESANSNLKHRPIGLGIMGFQDALYLQDINFDSEKAISFADESMELISYHAFLASTELASERGAYETFTGSKWQRGIMPLDTLDILEKERGEKIAVDRSSKLDWKIVKDAIKKHGMRNSNCIAIAPTATISNIAGCFPTIEPIYKNIYVKSNMSGEFTIVNPYLIEDLKKLNLWNQDMLEQIKSLDGNIKEIAIIPDKLRAKYKETFDIESHWYLEIAAHRGKWIDQSQSLNMYLQSNSGRLISDVYQYAWRLGLKTTYYLRTLAASSVEKSTLNLAQQRRVNPIKNQSTPLESSVATPKIACNINDPTCEACQ